MGLTKLYLHGIGHFHPQNVISNSFLESLDIGTSEEWILDRTGIKTRRTILDLDYIRSTKNKDPFSAYSHMEMQNRQTAALSAMQALNRATLRPHQIGMVLAGSCAPQHATPSEACTIAAELGLSVPALDIHSACSSFVAQLHWLSNTHPDFLPDYILLVFPENMTRTVNYQDRGSAVLWGDASAAAIVSPRIPTAVSIIKSVFESNPLDWQTVSIDHDGHFMQNGHAVQTFAIRKSLEVISALRVSAQSRTQSEYFIGHQANLLMLNAIVRRAEIPEEHHLYNVDRYGNCGTAGAMTVLSENWENFESGDELLLTQVGAGLSWGGVKLRWEDIQ